MIAQNKLPDDSFYPIMKEITDLSKNEDLPFNERIAAKYLVAFSSLTREVVLGTEALKNGGSSYIATFFVLLMLCRRRSRV